MGGTILIYYLLHRRMRPYVLLTASILFLWRLSLRALVIVLVTGIVVWLLGRAIEGLTGDASGERETGNAGAVQAASDARAARGLMIAGVALIVCALLVFKYVPVFFAQSSAAVADGEEAVVSPFVRMFLLPVGFSYYSFQSIGYLIDVYQGRIRAERNPFFFLLYLMYFPKFISGPIERPKDLLTQIRDLPSVRLLKEERLSLAASDLLYGYFMKSVVADRLALCTGPVFASCGWHSSAGLLLNLFFYVMQLYCDFAGYSAIAVGTSRIFGITLVNNFRAPYLSLGITEFWRRWHRSLSSWLRDYLYIPLGGNRRGTARKCLNTMIVFFVCGIWHGSSLTFVIWGLLQGIFSVIETLLRKKDKAVSFFWQIAGRVLTFAGIFCSWFFFGIHTLSDVPKYIQRMWTARDPGFTFEAEMIEIGMGMTELKLALLFLVPVVVFDILIYRADTSFAEAIARWPYVFRYLLFYVLIVVILVFGIYGAGYDAAGFMYMDF
ncbi:MAG: MBOAT family protein [Lachnospiraceae bacterium]|nr:MBOAT family protein [Lachnospiraceae bacterium]